MRLLLIILLLWALPIDRAAAQEDPNRVKAAFLRNFAHYVTWPEGAFADVHSPWRVCVLGRDPFGELLNQTLAGRTEQGRPFQVHRAETAEALTACQIIYIGVDDPAKRRAALGVLKDRPVLTVGDAREFLSEGGMIRFQVGGRVEMSINLDRTRAASLKVQTKMLEVSHQALENGALRRLR